MNSKKTLLLSVITSAVIVAAVTSIAQTRASRASNVMSVVTDVVTQALPEEATEETTEEMAEEAQQRVVPLPYMEKSKSTYKLNDPAIQFDYDPNFFVTELYEPSAETADAETTDAETTGSAFEARSPLVKSVNLWLKDDYLTLKSAGDELGDFPTRLKLSVYENPEGLPVEDWITTQAESILASEIESFEASAMTVEGRDVWTFTYTSLFRYVNQAFSSPDGQIVVITYGQDQSPNEVKNAHYGTAWTAMQDSLTVVVPEAEATEVAPEATEATEDSE